jgi:hypothetical protein
MYWMWLLIAAWSCSFLVCWRMLPKCWWMFRPTETCWYHILLNVPWMFPECSLKVPWMFLECATERSPSKNSCITSARCVLAMIWYTLHLYYSRPMIHCAIWDVIIPIYVKTSRDLHLHGPELLYTCANIFTIYYMSWYAHHLLIYAQGSFGGGVGVDEKLGSFTTKGDVLILFTCVRCIRPRVWRTRSSPHLHILLLQNFLAQRIFSHSGFLLVVGREYSHTLASYWSWASDDAHLDIYNVIMWASVRLKTVQIQSARVIFHYIDLAFYCFMISSEFLGYAWCLFSCLNVLDHAIWAHSPWTVRLVPGPCTYRSHMQLLAFLAAGQTWHILIFSVTWHDKDIVFSLKRIYRASALWFLLQCPVIRQIKQNRFTKIRSLGFESPKLLNSHVCVFQREAEP